MNPSLHPAPRATGPRATLITGLLALLAALAWIWAPPAHAAQSEPGALPGGGLRDAGWQRKHMARNRLAILPDLTHHELFASPRLADTALPFLDGRSDARSWAAQASR